MNGRLGDFGLARLHEHGSGSNTTRVVGTLGYLAPELPRTGKASTASDVYALGALLLEVVCGRRPIEPNGKPEELVLVDWVWGRFRDGRVLEVVDERLEGVYDEREIVMVVKLGLMCSAHGPRVRPNMRMVVRYLDGEIEVPEEVRAPSGSRMLGFDEFLGSFTSSSFDGRSCCSNREMDTSLASLSSTSPVCLLHHGQTI